MTSEKSGGLVRTQEYVGKITLFINTYLEWNLRSLFLNETYKPDYYKTILAAFQIKYFIASRIYLG